MDASHECDLTGTALALALLRHHSDSVYLMDPDGRLTMVNRAAAAELGLDDASRVQGRHWTQIWTCLDHETLRAGLVEAAEGEAVRMTLHCPGLEGEDQHRAVTLCPIEGNDGRIAKILCIAHAAAG
ncbi:PAS domain-containing protein [Paracoccus sp. Z118]|uniref:PAS domain-containing protein n=1 Tax=Paracoccus sp. Z118 TaxID=2851017 RepID=UPI001C2C0E81|nr:PAS domain-containing protein [Paracoccus sp. Z118]MBV0892846.1 PAS domain-containing protein [Paracoccus sp. Z118]